MAGVVRPTRTGTVPWPDGVTARYLAAGYWEGRSIAAHFHTVARTSPDKVALVDGDHRMTYRALAARIDGAAIRLRALGLRPDDRIIVQLPNSWELVVLTLACLRLGTPPVLALPAHRRHELDYLAQLTDARAIAVPSTRSGFDHQTMAADLAAQSQSLEHILVAGDTIHPGHTDLRALCAPAPDPDAARTTLDAAAPDGADVALFLLSSGTTGLPKLIARTHNDYAYTAKQSAHVCDFGPNSVYLAVLPISHSYTLGGPGILGTLLSGGRVVIAGSLVPGRALTTIQRERVTVTSLVPAIAQRWLVFREEDPSHDLSSLRQLQVGGARLPTELARRITPLLGCTLQQGYGMAEGLICFTRPGDPEEVACTTQGRPIGPADELMLIDENGSMVAPGEPGILLTRGPTTPRGYYRAPVHNAQAFTPDGWYRTGDIVRIRPDGNLVIEGREKDMINRGGEKISAEEVENFAYQVDGVLEAAAVAMPDSALGERVCLFVVVNREVTLQDVRAAMRRAEVASFKLPERLVVVDSLPTTNVGKVDKMALRAEIADRSESEKAA